MAICPRLALPGRDELAQVAHAVDDMAGQLATHQRELAAQQMAMAESSARYRALFESSLDGIVLIDEMGDVVDANPTFRRLAGLSQDVLVGRAFHRLLDDDSRADWNGPMREQLESRGYTDEFELKLLTVAGEPAAVATKCMRLADSRGVRRGGWCLLRDLSERKQAAIEQRLAAAVYDSSSGGHFGHRSGFPGVHGQPGLCAAYRPGYGDAGRQRAASPSSAAVTRATAPCSMPCNATAAGRASTG